MADHFRVLSIDGGGIRGLIPAMVLDHIENVTGKQIWELFDLIAGTSTGGILALGLTKPHSEGKRAEFFARDIINLYEENGGRIFSKRFGRSLVDERYPSHTIEAVLEEYFGDARLSDSLTEVLLTSYEIERRRPIVFKRMHARSNGAKRREHDLPMKQLARATSAAPTYFEPMRIDMEAPRDYLALVDGGVYANNPALCAYVEANRLKEPDQHILLISLGTGELTHPLRYDDVKDWGLLTWARQIIDVVFDGVSDNVQYLIEQLAAEGDYIFRFQVRLNEDTSALDNVKPENLRALKLVAEELIFQERQKLEKLCRILPREAETPQAGETETITEAT